MLLNLAIVAFLGSAAAMPQGAPGVEGTVNGAVNGASDALGVKAAAPMPEKAYRQTFPGAESAVGSEGNPSAEAAAAYKRQAGGGATLGSLLAAVGKITDQLGEEVPELEEPAKDLSTAISDFEDAAKDVKAPSGSESSGSESDS